MSPDDDEKDVDFLGLISLIHSFNNSGSGIGLKVNTQKAGHPEYLRSRISPSSVICVYVTRQT